MVTALTDCPFRCRTFGAIFSQDSTSYASSSQTHQKDSREFEFAWKAILLVTPYIRVKRGCAGDKCTPYYFCLEDSTSREVMCKSQSGTAFQADKESDCFLSEGILSFRRVCTSVTHSVAFQAIPELFQFFRFLQVRGFSGRTCFSLMSLAKKAHSDADLITS